MSVRILLVKLDILCFQNNETAIGHGILGIDHQIHDHLLNLPDIHPHLGGRGDKFRSIRMSSRTVRRDQGKWRGSPR